MTVATATETDVKKRAEALASCARSAIVRNMAAVQGKINILPPEDDASRYYDLLDSLRFSLDELARSELSRLNASVNGETIAALEEQAARLEKTAEDLARESKEWQEFANNVEAATRFATAILTLFL